MPRELGVEDFVAGSPFAASQEIGIALKRRQPERGLVDDRRSGLKGLVGLEVRLVKALVVLLNRANLFPFRLQLLEVTAFVPVPGRRDEDPLRRRAIGFEGSRALQMRALHPARERRFHEANQVGRGIDELAVEFLHDSTAIFA